MTNLELTTVDHDAESTSLGAKEHEDKNVVIENNGNGYKTVPIVENQMSPKSLEKETSRNSMFHKREGLGMSWSDLKFVVKNEINVLKSVNGGVESGEVCAIMGPSGSGKSSLLNVLAGRSASGGDVKITGTVKVGGKVINPVQFRKQIAYVMQDDALMATATPREAIRFSAALRMDKLTPEEIEEAVDVTLKSLGIEECADTFIGNAMIKGISGGQRKRTSVGVELITQPSLLFLDEPTSGLDSHTAYNLVKLLRDIASSNATILCTIHQPSSEVFFLFDSCIFLKEGQILYQGAVKTLTQHFSKFGYECPQNYNPADFVMFITQSETSQEFEKRGIFSAVVKKDSSAASEEKQAGAYQVDIKSGVFRQMKWLVHREFLNTKRNIPAFVGRFGVTIILNIIFGLIFLGAGNKDNADQNHVNAHFGSLTMVFISSMFGSAQPTLLEFPFERPMFMREYSTGTYSVVTYSLAKLAMEIPILFLQALVQFVIVWNMVEFQGNFILLVLAAFGTGAASSSLAVFLGCLVADVKTATEASPLLFVPQILFAGFFIRTSLIPVWLRWAQYICSLKYGLNLAITVEFAASQDACSESDDAAANCAKIIHNNNIKPDDFWIYILCLFAIFAALRALAMFLLAKKAVKFY